MSDVTAGNDGKLNITALNTMVGEQIQVDVDLVVLAAPFDSRHFESFTHLGVNNGASGAALLLEMARVLKINPLPYTVWLAFLDGEAAHAEDARPDDVGMVRATGVLALGNIASRVMGLALSAEDIAALEARTEGWIAGLQLAALALSRQGQQDVTRFIKSFTGSHHYTGCYPLILM